MFKPFSHVEANPTWEYLPTHQLPTGQNVIKKPKIMSAETFQDVYIGHNDVQTMILTLTHNSFRENAPLVYLHLKLFLLKNLDFSEIFH